MRRHYKMVHLKERTICNVCGEHVLSMWYHEKNCNPENVRVFKCHICDKSLSNKISLNAHIESIHENKRFICSVCCKEVKQLESHMKRVHSEDELQRKYPCTESGCASSAFKTKQDLERHIKAVHRGEKEECPICHDMLKNLPLHLYTTHKQGKQHVCNSCGKIFYKTFELNQHIQRVHLGGSFKQECSLCGAQVVKLSDHMKNVHSAMYS